LPDGTQYRVTLPASKRARIRAYVRAQTGIDARPIGWLEIPLSEALDAIAQSRCYVHDTRHPAVKAYVDMWEANRSPKAGATCAS
jgi:hypothetical protein